MLDRIRPSIILCYGQLIQPELYRLVEEAGAGLVEYPTYWQERRPKRTPKKHSASASSQEG